MDSTAEHAEQMMRRLSTDVSRRVWAVGLPPVLYAQVEPALDAQSCWTSPSGQHFRVLRNEES